MRSQAGVSAEDSLIGRTREEHATTPGPEASEVPGSTNEMTQEFPSPGPQQSPLKG